MPAGLIQIVVLWSRTTLRRCTRRLVNTARRHPSCCVVSSVELVCSRIHTNALVTAAALPAEGLGSAEEDINKRFSAAGCRGPVHQPARVGMWQHPQPVHASARLRYLQGHLPEGVTSRDELAVARQASGKGSMILLQTPHAEGYTPGMHMRSCGSCLPLEPSLKEQLSLRNFPHCFESAKRLPAPRLRCIRQLQLAVSLSASPRAGYRHRHPGGHLPQAQACNLHGGLLLLDIKVSAAYAS